MWRWDCGAAIRRTVLAGVVAAFASPGLAEPVAPRAILDGARSAVEDFRTGHTSFEYSAAVARADAALVMPALDEATASGGGDQTGRPAVAVVRDGVMGPWSDPAFYRVRSADGEAPYPNIDMLFLIMRADAIPPLKEGSAVLGGEDGLRVDPVNVGVNAQAQADPRPHMIAFVKISEASTALPTFDGWRVTADEALNASYYKRNLTPAEILSRGAAETGEPESLLDALRAAEDDDASTIRR